MPHIIVEYNSAIENSYKVDDLVRNLHAVALAHKDLPNGGIRVRAYCSEKALVGDGADANGFIYIIVRLGHGRSVEIKKNIGDKMFGVLTDFTQSSFDDGNPLSLGLEIQEIEKEWTWKKNNIHQILKDKNNGSN